MGAVLIAIVVSAVLHGICLLQASQYFRSTTSCWTLPFFSTLLLWVTEFPNDRTYLRIMVRPRFLYARFALDP